MVQPRGLWFEPRFRPFWRAAVPPILTPQPSRGVLGTPMAEGCYLMPLKSWAHLKQGPL